MFGMIGVDDANPNANYAPVIIQTAIAMMVLSIIATILRFGSRRVARQPFKLDDWLIVVGLLFAWATCLVQIVSTNFGYGKHIFLQTPENVRKYLICLWIAQIVYVSAVGVIKLSIISFYRRIFDVQSTKWPAFAIAAITISWMIALLVAGMLSCQPIHKFWDREIEGKCISTPNYFWSVAIPNLVTDLMLLVFPLPMIWGLQLPTSKKIAMSGVFTLGGFIICVSCLHLVTVVAVEGALDLTFVLVPLGLWNAIECNIGLVLACLPSMFPLVRLCLGKKARTTKNSQSAQSGGSNVSRKPYWPRSKTNDTELSSFSRLRDNDDSGLQGFGDSAKLHTRVNADAVEQHDIEASPPLGGIKVRSEIKWRTDQS